MVVSSDHRVQRAARRRRAKAVDSDRWWAELNSDRRSRRTERPTAPQKPTVDLSAGEVDYWVKQFGDVPEETRGKVKKSKPAVDLDNPFPPGYAEDLLKDE